MQGHIGNTWQRQELSPVELNSQSMAKPQDHPSSEEFFHALTSLVRNLMTSACSCLSKDLMIWLDAMKRDVQKL